MGRWAQQRRRGGGVSPTLGGPPSLLSLDSNGSPTVVATFSAAVTVVAGNSSSALSIAGNDVDAASNQTGTVINLTCESNSSPGDAWALTSQPAWCTTPLVFPASGTTI